MRNRKDWDETSRLALLCTELPRPGDCDETPQFALPYTGCPRGLRSKMHQHVLIYTEWPEPSCSVSKEVVAAATAGWWWDRPIDCIGSPQTIS